jgi:cytochrome c oxidase cbb3-type subunit III
MKNNRVMQKRFLKLFFTALALSVVSIQAQETAEPIQQLAENASANRTIFYVLGVFGLFLIVAIFTMSSTLSSLLKSDYFKQRYAEKFKNNSSTIAKVIVLVLGFSWLPSVSHALTFNGISEEHCIDVTRSDVWMLLVIDAILLFTFLYLRYMVRGMFREVMSEKRKQKEEAVAKRAKSITQILTDRASEEEEESIMMDHEYDGIRELDNNLPPWWKWGFYVSIVFAVVYLLHYHVFKTGDLQAQEYEKSIAKADAEVKAYLEKAALNVDENSVVLLTDAEALSKGKDIYIKNCAVCHGQAGEGVVGPNLSDKFWLYGGGISDVFKTVKYGAERGMQAWADKLNPVEMQQVSSFILNLDYTEGKEPEGTEYTAKSTTEPIVEEVKTDSVKVENE